MGAKQRAGGFRGGLHPLIGGRIQQRPDLRQRRRQCRPVPRAQMADARFGVGPRALIQPGQKICPRLRQADRPLARIPPPFTRNPAGFLETAKDAADITRVEPQIGAQIAGQNTLGRRPPV